MRAAVAVFFVARVALAGTGGAFSGPTTATGASVTWNPAALATAPDGTTALIEVTGLLLGASYARTDPAGEQEYPEVSFTTAAPDMSFSLAYSTPWSPLRVIAGGYSPNAIGTLWPEDGPQRYHATTSFIAGYCAGAGLLLAWQRYLSVAALAGPCYFRAQARNAMDFGAFANSHLPAGASLFALEDEAMTGWVQAGGSDWTRTLVVGVFSEPIAPLRLGVALVYPTDIHLEGDVRIELPEAASRALPDYELRPTGKLKLHFPQNWNINAEAQLQLSPWALALTYSFSPRSQHRVAFGTITEAEPQFIEGRMVSVSYARDDWSVGARAMRGIDEQLALVLRVDYNRRDIPDEAMTPASPDFTQIQFSLGARYRITSELIVAASYSYVHIPSVDVKKSLYSPYAPDGSGLNKPAGTGVYGAYGHKLVLSFEGLWPG